jgi:hypothetical protein
MVGVLVFDVVPVEVKLVVGDVVGEVVGVVTAHSLKSPEL